MADTTTNEKAASSDRATQLRNQVVDDLIAEGTIVSAPVEAAMRKVPRELFAPGVNLEEVYHRYNGVVTKRDEDGNSISSVSAPQVQEHMLEQAEIAVGMRVLERSAPAGTTPRCWPSLSVRPARSSQLTSTKTSPTGPAVCSPTPGTRG